MPKRVGWPCPVRSALKRTSEPDFNSISITFYYYKLLAPHIKKLETYFALFIFLDFRTVCEPSAHKVVLLESVIVCKSKISTIFDFNNF